MTNHVVRVTRYSVTGLIATATHALIAAGLIRLVGAEPSVANGIAFLCATTVSYLINTLWSFSAPVGVATIRRFVLVSMLGFVAAMLVAGMVEGWGGHYVIGILAVAVSVPPLTFALHSLWTYR